MEVKKYTNKLSSVEHEEDCRISLCFRSARSIHTKSTNKNTHTPIQLLATLSCIGPVSSSLMLFQAELVQREDESVESLDLLRSFFGQQFTVRYRWKRHGTNLFPSLTRHLPKETSPWPNVLAYRFAFPSPGERTRNSYVAIFAQAI